MTEEQEVEGVGLMILYYCKKKHKAVRQELGLGKDEMCPECKELHEYVKVRRHKCPFGDDKPFCSACKIHCYKPSMREKIRAVMRFAAPRVAIFHPIMALKHFISTKKRKREIKAEEEEKRRLAENSAGSNLTPDNKEANAPLNDKDTHNIEGENNG